MLAESGERCEINSYAFSSNSLVLLYFFIQTLDNCWTDPTCNRVMTIAHGGDWNASYPYDSKPAFQKAWEVGADAVKGDFRVSSDNIGTEQNAACHDIYELYFPAGTRHVEVG